MFKILLWKIDHGMGSAYFRIGAPNPLYNNSEQFIMCCGGGSRNRFLIVFQFECEKTLVFGKIQSNFNQFHFLQIVNFQFYYFFKRNVSKMHSYKIAKNEKISSKKVKFHQIRSNFMLNLYFFSYFFKVWNSTIAAATGVIACAVVMAPPIWASPEADQCTVLFSIKKFEFQFSEKWYHFESNSDYEIQNRSNFTFSEIDKKFLKIKVFINFWKCKIWSILNFLIPIQFKITHFFIKYSNKFYLIVFKFCKKDRARTGSSNYQWRRSWGCGGKWKKVFLNPPSCSLWNGYFMHQNNDFQVQIAKLSPWNVFFDFTNLRKMNFKSENIFDEKSREVKIFKMEI